MHYVLYHGLSKTLVGANTPVGFLLGFASATVDGGRATVAPVMTTEVNCAKAFASASQAFSWLELLKESVMVPEIYRADSPFVGWTALAVEDDVEIELT